MGRTLAQRETGISALRDSMIQRIAIYVLAISIPIVAYFAHDYGQAGERRRSDEAAKALTKFSVGKANELRKLKAERSKKYVETVYVVRNAKDETNCLDTVAPKPVRDSLRDLQSVSR